MRSASTLTPKEAEPTVTLGWPKLAWHSEDGGPVEWFGPDDIWIFAMLTAFRPEDNIQFSFAPRRTELTQLDAGQGAVTMLQRTSDHKA